MGPESESSGSSWHEYHGEYGELHREYDRLFDSWNLVCSQVMLGGLISNQNRGGIRVLSLHLDDKECSVTITVLHHQVDPPIQINNYVDLRKLRSMAPEDDAASAASIYLEDLILRPLTGPEIEADIQFSRRFPPS